MRGVTMIVEKEWFETIFIDKHQNRVVRLTLRAKTGEKMRHIEDATLATS